MEHGSQALFSAQVKDKFQVCCFYLEKSLWPPDPSHDCVAIVHDLLALTSPNNTLDQQPPCCSIN